MIIVVYDRFPTVFEISIVLGSAELVGLEFRCVFCAPKTPLVVEPYERSLQIPF